MDPAGKLARRAGGVLVRDRRAALPSGALLVASNLGFSYPAPADSVAIRGAFLQARRDQLTCVHGAHESGKTTLAQLLANRLTPSAGTISIDGARLCESQTAYVGFPPRENWPEGMTPLDRLTNDFAAAGFHGRFLSQRQARDTLKAGGLWDIARLPREALTNLDRARVAALAGLIHLPAWLIVDDLEQKINAHDVSRLVEFVVGCCSACRVGVVWISSASVRPLLRADRTYTLRDGYVTAAA